MKQELDPKALERLHSARITTSLFSQQFDALATQLHLFNATSVDARISYATDDEG